MNNKILKIPVLSFYSGGGFLDMGFEMAKTEMAKFEIVWTNEFDKIFAQLHSSGITSWRKSRGNGVRAEIFNTNSITDINSDDIIKEAFPEKKPKIFGIIGGPPCQDFSINGRLEGFEGERGKLTIIYINKILELQPAFFVIENVTGLLKIKSTKEYFFKLLLELEKDYYIDRNILNALDFGVPQFRERIFIVGVSKSLIPESYLKPGLSGQWFPWPENYKFKDALKRFIWPKIDHNRKLITKPDNIPLKLCVESCLVPDELINQIPNANEFFDLKNKSKTYKIQEGDTIRPSFKKLHRYRYSPTACYGNNEVHLHPYKNRRLSVREALRIQGVPDEYVLPKEIGLSKKFKMIGNGVPVPLAEAVAVSLLLFLESYIND